MNWWDIHIPTHAETRERQLVAEGYPMREAGWQADREQQAAAASWHRAFIDETQGDATQDDGS